MGFNYAAEKKKFETLWARLRREYRAAGMSDAAIQKMHDFDWEVFKQERIYRLHTQDLGIGIFCCITTVPEFWPCRHSLALVCW